MQVSTQSSRFTHCLVVKLDGTWQLFLYGKLLDAACCSALVSQPQYRVTQFTHIITGYVYIVCPGHPDFIDFLKDKKRKLVGRKECVTALLDSSACTATVHSSKCEMLLL